MDIQTYDSGVGILATRKFEAIGVMVAGGQDLKAGSLVGGEVLTGVGNEVSLADGGDNAPDAEGVLLYGVDTTGGEPKIGTMIIRGNIDLGKIPVPNPAGVEELKGRIIFMV